jgi:hypothetical protein
MVLSKTKSYVGGWRSQSGHQCCTKEKEYTCVQSARNSGKIIDHTIAPTNLSPIQQLTQGSGVFSAILFSQRKYGER